MITSPNAFPNLSCHGRPQGGVGKSRRSSPPPGKSRNFVFSIWGGGPFYSFFSMGGLFATFFSLWGAFSPFGGLFATIISTWGHLCYVFHRVGAFFVFMGSLFWACPPPPPPTKTSAGSHVPC